MTMVEFSAEKTRVLDAEGHILVLGGPGSGKTTIALAKANSIALSGRLQSQQRVLFLSFARATVARALEVARDVVTTDGLPFLELNTYHGFAWNLLRSHGYLLNGHRSVRLISPPDASALLAGIRDKTDRRATLRRLFDTEGVLHFDLFAELSAELLTGSASLRKIISRAYPVIVLDEFQDTDPAEWRLMELLGQNSTLVALADLDQRIYEFRGADPLRIESFVASHKPIQFDFGVENQRSAGTDIVAFGNDLISGQNIGRSYNDVEVSFYRVLKGVIRHLDLKLRILKTVRRLHDAIPNQWSLAILVPTNTMMIDVSDFLESQQKLQNGKTVPSVRHDVAFDNAGPSLAAIVIATLLEGGADTGEIAKRLLLSLREYIRGRHGDGTPNASEMDVADFLSRYVKDGKVKGSNRKALIDDCLNISSLMRAAKHTGDCGEDWLNVRRLLSESGCELLRDVAQDAKYLRLLHKGSMLRSRLGALWRSGAAYAGAVGLVRDALRQEFLAAAPKEWRGIHVMTIHKSKGKEFDEVIVYEGRYRDRIVPEKADDKRIAQARRNLRVAVTRAKRHTAILTPADSRCALL